MEFSNRAVACMRLAKARRVRSELSRKKKEQAVLDKQRRNLQREKGITLPKKADRSVLEFLGGRTLLAMTSPVVSPDEAELTRILYRLRKSKPLKGGPREDYMAWRLERRRVVREMMYAGYSLEDIEARMGETKHIIKKDVQMIRDFEEQRLERPVDQKHAYLTLVDATNIYIAKLHRTLEVALMGHVQTETEKPLHEDSDNDEVIGSGRRGGSRSRQKVKQSGPAWAAVTAIQGNILQALKFLRELQYLDKAGAGGRNPSTEMSVTGDMYDDNLTKLAALIKDRKGRFRISSLELLGPVEETAKDVTPPLPTPSASGASSESFEDDDDEEDDN